MDQMITFKANQIHFFKLKIETCGSYNRSSNSVIWNYTFCRKCFRLVAFFSLCWFYHNVNRTLYCKVVE